MTLLAHFGIVVPSMVDEVLGLLEDGESHGFPEIARNFRLSEDEVGRVVGFLAKYGFVDVDEEQRMVKLSSVVLSFIQTIRRLEKE